MRVEAYLRHWRLWAAAAVIVLAVFAIYGQTVGHGFINYDDDTYIYSNSQVPGGLTWEGVAWAFGLHAGNWHPLTWLSHMLDTQLFGLWAGGHHLMGTVLHAANAVLVFLVLRGMTGAFWRSAVVAMLFAVHPLRVESVAWAAERKDVLSGLFWLLTTGAYVRYARHPRGGRYLAVVALFALGLAAKPMLVTLPFTLLLLDAWPLGRAARGHSPGRIALWRNLVMEKVPLMALTVGSILITYRAQTEKVAPMATPELGDRIANAATSTMRYLAMFFWPRDLAILYPYPLDGIPVGPAAAGATVLVLAVIAGFALRRRMPYLLGGWLWYLGTLVPVIGLIQVGAQTHADRYTYLPLLGITTAVVWFTADRWPEGPFARRTLALLATAGIMALTATAAVQTALWRNSIAVLEHTVRVTKDNYIIMNNLASALSKEGRVDEGIALLEETVRIKPDHCNASYNLGLFLLNQGKPREALPPLHRSLRCYREQKLRLEWIADTFLNIAAAYSKLGLYAEAERYYRELLHISPRNAWARRMLQYVQQMQGRKSRLPSSPHAAPRLEEGARTGTRAQ